MKALTYNPEQRLRVCRSEYLYPVECDKDCAGPIAKGVMQPNSPPEKEGYYVVVCQSLRKRSLPDDGVDFCGNGPNVISMHREGFPTDAEVFDSANDQEL